jgi:nucleoside-diphosphate-sugar epimerase
MSKGSNWSGFDFSPLAGTKALVTGGAGFIGSHLATALDSIGVKVTVLDDLCGGGDPKALPPGVEFVKGSILDLPLVEKCTAGCQYVFHQAALGSVPKSVEQPRQFHDVNVTGTLNVLESARHAGVKRVMFAASSSAYGDSPTLPKVETMPAIPRSPYAANKVACEAMLSAYAASYPIDTVNLRYFNIFGPRQSPDNAYAAVIAAFAKALLKGQHPHIYGDGEQSRDFTYVDNVVLANLLAAKHETKLNGTVLNVACGQRVTVTELAKEMASLLDRSDLTPIYKEERAGDVKHSLADLSLTTKTLGYRPIVAFRDGLATTVKWYATVLPRS